jgi:hypothetical protein
MEIDPGFAPFGFVLFFPVKLDLVDSITNTPLTMILEMI